MSVLSTPGEIARPRRAPGRGRGCNQVLDVLEIGAQLPVNRAGRSGQVYSNL